MRKEYLALWGIETSPPLPWTAEQVQALNRCQTMCRFPVFTCGNDRHDMAHVAYASNHLVERGQLVATTTGWTCPVCGYHQGWAHRAMFVIGSTSAQWPEMMKGFVWR